MPDLVSPTRPGSADPRRRSASRGAGGPNAWIACGIALLWLLALPGCGPTPAPLAGASQAGASSAAFEFVRTPLGLVRTDTRTGRVWVVAPNGDGGWLERGEAPDLAGLPADLGRFETLLLGPDRGSGRAGTASTAVLARVDHATGRAWLLASETSRSWAAVRDTDAPPDLPSSVAPAASAPPEQSPAPSPDPPRSSPVLDEDSPDSYPILTGDQLGITPEKRQEALETLRNALDKEGLPRKMRVWAVRQMGELEPDLAVPELLVALDDRDPVVVAEAVRQLGRSGRASTIPRILELSDHPDAGVRAAVSETVIEIR